MLETRVVSMMNLFVTKREYVNIVLRLLKKMSITCYSSPILFIYLMSHLQRLGQRPLIETKF